MNRPMLRAIRKLLSPARPSDATAPGPDALVQVYQRPAGFYVEPSDRTRTAEAGFWVATGEVTVLTPDATDAALGDAVRRAVAASRVEVAVPPRDAKLEAGLFRAMGVRSRRAAMDGTHSCMVSREPVSPATAGRSDALPRLRIEALHNGGTNGDGRGYHGIDGVPALELPVDTSVADLGHAVRAMLQQSTVVG